MTRNEMFDALTRAHKINPHSDLVKLAFRLGAEAVTIGRGGMLVHMPDGTGFHWESEE